MRDLCLCCWRILCARYFSCTCRLLKLKVSNYLAVVASLLLVQKVLVVKLHEQFWLKSTNLRLLAGYKTNFRLINDLSMAEKGIHTPDTTFWRVSWLAIAILVANFRAYYNRIQTLQNLLNKTPHTVLYVAQELWPCNCKKRETTIFLLHIGISAFYCEECERSWSACQYSYIITLWRFRMSIVPACVYFYWRARREFADINLAHILYFVFIIQ
jgi:hypothetical protein